ncbi:MAG TPA: FtsX-like permease family protein [Tepidisphaeraceae bacterium]|nr:FtsX-like permease family protein [Tepidisphaeraceae bacterium]
MKLIFKLALANVRTHKVRMTLTVAAIALSVSLIVAVTSGYASAQAAAHRGISIFIGSTDAQITRNQNLRGGIGHAVIEALEKDPDVLFADGRLELSSSLLKLDGTPAGGLAQVIGLQRPEADNVQGLRMEQGHWFENPQSNDAVIDQVAMERLQAKIGDEFILPAIDRQLKLRIIGVVHKPNILAAAMQTIYLPLKTLQEFMLPQQSDQVSRVLIQFRTGTDPQAFYDRWSVKLPAIEPDLRLRLSSQTHRDMDKNLQGLEVVSYFGGSVAMLAAMFIIFSSLSMGVSERQRTLAMLRAVGAVRSQLGWLVVSEAIFLACLGIIIGIPLGVLWIKLLAWQFDFLFTAGGVVNIGGAIYAAIGSLVTALAASFLPALGAMRASPLEAMTPLSSATPNRGIHFSLIVGLLMLCVDPLVLWSGANRNVVFYLHCILGVPTVMVGWFLVSPVLVNGIERLIGPVLAKVFGLRLALLRQQLSRSTWRSAGAAAALMVGLAVLIVTQTQGTTAIAGWKLPDHFPDAFIYSYLGLDAADQKKLAELPEIRPGGLSPIAMASPEFGVSVFGIAGAALVPDATMFFGIDPDQALTMLDLDWRDGNPEDAKRMLKLGRHVIVTQEYKQLRGLGVNDKLPLKTNQGVVDFTIAGVVWSPGIDVITSTHDLSLQFDQRTAASLFGTLEDAKTYFGVERIHLFAANLKGDVEKSQLITQFKTTMRGKGLDVGDVRQVKFMIQQIFSRLLQLASTIAYAAMAVASVGVTNTIMASVRSRRWHLGVLRSIGATRGQILRLILAEAILLGLAGIILGLMSGFHLELDAHHAWGVFFGYEPPLVVPFVPILIGAATIMAVSILASLWPAAHAARSQPLTLLSAGRASI